MTPENALPTDLAAALERLDYLVCTFNEHPDPAVQERAVALLQAVDRIHRGGLRRLADLLRISGLEQPALTDPEIRLLFELYDLTEGGERARADAVLDGARPFIESHGGRLDVVRADAGVVTVRLSESCHGCAGSAATLREMVERTLREGLPDFVRMEVVESPSPPAGGFVPLEGLMPPR